MQSIHLFRLFGFICFSGVGQKLSDWAFDQEEVQHNHYDHQRHRSRAQMSITWTRGVTWPSSERTGSSYQWFVLTETGPCLHRVAPNDLCVPSETESSFVAAQWQIHADLGFLWMAVVWMKYGLQKLRLTPQQWDTAPKGWGLSMLSFTTDRTQTE